VDFDWEGFGQVDFSRVDFGQVDFGQVDFGQVDFSQVGEGVPGKVQPGPAGAEVDFDWEGFGLTGEGVSWEAQSGFTYGDMDLDGLGMGFPGEDVSRSSQGVMVPPPVGSAASSVTGPNTASPVDSFAAENIVPGGANTKVPNFPPAGSTGVPTADAPRILELNDAYTSERALEPLRSDGERILDDESWRHSDKGYDDSAASWARHAAPIGTQDIDEVRSRVAPVLFFAESGGLTNDSKITVSADGRPKFDLRTWRSAIGFETRRLEFPNGTVVQDRTFRIFLYNPNGYDLSLFRVTAKEGVTQIWNNGYALPRGDQLNVNVEFTDDPREATGTITVTPAGSHPNQLNIPLDAAPAVFAHEIAGHFGGLDDQYSEEYQQNPIIFQHNRTGKIVRHLDNSKSVVGTGRIVSDNGIMGSRADDPGAEVKPRDLWRLDKFGPNLHVIAPIKVESLGAEPINVGNAGHGGTPFIVNGEVKIPSVLGSRKRWGWGNDSRHAVVLGGGADEAVPRLIHFVWMGGELSVAAKNNIGQWVERAAQSGWKVRLWIDDAAGNAPGNRQFIADLAERRPGTLRQKLIDRSLLNSLPGGSKVPSLLDSNARKLFGVAHGSGAFAMASDIARYHILHLKGGVYIDVDLAPGGVRLPQDLRMSNTGAALPFLAPRIRDQKEYQDEIDRMSAAHNMSNMSETQKYALVVSKRYADGDFNNSLIVVPPGSKFVKHLIDGLPKPDSYAVQMSIVGNALSKDAGSLTGPGFIRRQILTYLQKHNRREGFLKWKDFTSSGLGIDAGQRAVWDSVQWLTGESEVQLGADNTASASKTPGFPTEGFGSGMVGEIERASSAAAPIRDVDRFVSEDPANYGDDSDEYGYQTDSADGMEIDAGMPTEEKLREREDGNDSDEASLDADDLMLIGEDLYARRLGEALSRDLVDVSEVYAVLQLLDRDADRIREFEREFQYLHGRSLADTITDAIERRALQVTQFPEIMRLLGHSDTFFADPRVVPAVPSTAIETSMIDLSMLFPEMLPNVARFAAALNERMSNSQFDEALTLLRRLDRNERALRLVIGAYMNQTGRSLLNDLSSHFGQADIDQVTTRTVASSVSAEHAEQLYARMQGVTVAHTSGDLPMPFDHPEDGCYIRAHLWVLKLRQWGVDAHQVWVYRNDGARLTVVSSNGLGGTPDVPVRFTWSYHVAPLVLVDYGDGLSPRPMVLDPAMGLGVVTVDDWIGAAGVQPGSWRARRGPGVPKAAVPIPLSTGHAATVEVTGLNAWPGKFYDGPELADAPSIESLMREQEEIALRELAEEVGRRREFRAWHDAASPSIQATLRSVYPQLSLSSRRNFHERYREASLEDRGRVIADFHELVQWLNSDDDGDISSLSDIDEAVLSDIDDSQQEMEPDEDAESEEQSAPEVVAETNSGPLVRAPDGTVLPPDAVAAIFEERDRVTRWLDGLSNANLLLDSAAFVVASIHQPPRFDESTNTPEQAAYQDLYRSVVYVVAARLGSGAPIGPGMQSEAEAYARRLADVLGTRRRQGYMPPGTSRPPVDQFEIGGGGESSRSSAGRATAMSAEVEWTGAPSAASGPSPWGSLLPVGTPAPSTADLDANEPLVRFGPGEATAATADSGSSTSDDCEDSASVDLSRELTSHVPRAATADDRVNADAADRAPLDEVLRGAKVDLERALDRGQDTLTELEAAYESRMAELADVEADIDNRFMVAVVDMVDRGNGIEPDAAGRACQATLDVLSAELGRLRAERTQLARRLDAAREEVTHAVADIELMRAFADTASAAVAPFQGVLDELAAKIEAAREMAGAARTEWWNAKQELDRLTGATSPVERLELAPDTFVSDTFVQDLFDRLDADVLPVARPVELRTGDWTSDPLGSSPLTADRLEREFGMPKVNQDRFRAVADRFGLVIDVRPTNPASVRWLEQGAMPKPQAIKAKTINTSDTYLGASAANIGLVGYFDPREPDAESLPSVIRNQVWLRYQERKAEYAELAADMADLARQGRYHVVDGVVVAHTPTGDRNITGDHDVFHIRTPDDGAKLSPDDYDLVVWLLTRRGMGVQHGAHVYWEPADGFQRKSFENIMDRHRRSSVVAEPLVRFSPGEPVRLVYADEPARPAPVRMETVPKAESAEDIFGVWNWGDATPNQAPGSAADTRPKTSTQVWNIVDFEQGADLLEDDEVRLLAEAAVDGALTGQQSPAVRIAVSGQATDLAAIEDERSALVARVDTELLRLDGNSVLGVDAEALVEPVEFAGDAEDTQVTVTVELPPSGPVASS
jgi:outer membrane murein-binding lipoprotein Lpp